ncbi:MAG: hypothetical protein VB858_05830, partial [Planctomycetaceae bacterium]
RVLFRSTHHPWRFFEEELESSFTRLRQWVRHTHWKDSVRHRAVTATDDTQPAADQAHSLMSGHRHADYVLFGEGEFPARQCMSLLRNAGYAGWYCLEWEQMWHPELEPPEVALPPFPSRIRELWDQADPRPGQGDG